MTQRKDKSLNDSDFLKQMVETYLQEYLDQDMSRHLNALPYERTGTRHGHRNDYKSRHLNIQVGKLFIYYTNKDGSFLIESISSPSGFSD
jgi:transposase-like protein